MLWIGAFYYHQKQELAAAGHVTIRSSALQLSGAEKHNGVGSVVDISILAFKGLRDLHVEKYFRWLQMLWALGFNQT